MAPSCACHRATGEQHAQAEQRRPANASQRHRRAMVGTTVFAAVQSQRQTPRRGRARRMRRCVHPAAAPDPRAPRPTGANATAPRRSRASVQQRQQAADVALRRRTNPKPRPSERRSACLGTSRPGATTTVSVGMSGPASATAITPRCAAGKPPPVHRDRPPRRSRCPWPAPRRAGVRSSWSGGPLRLRLMICAFVRNRELQRLRQAQAAAQRGHGRLLPTGAQREAHVPAARRRRCRCRCRPAPR